MKYVKIIFIIFAISLIMWGFMFSQHNEKKNIIDYLVGVKNEESIAKKETIARNWNEIFLSQKYLPPEKSRFVILTRKDDTDVDKVRIRYEVNGNVITITQTLCVFAIQIDFESKKGRLYELEEIVNIAHGILKDSDELELIATHEEKDKKEGNAKIKKETKTPWLNGLFWEHDLDRAIFYFIKDDGMASALDKGLDFESNANWFKQH